jgi:hypothetical protein
MPIEMRSYVELKDVFPDQEVSLGLLAECLGALPLDLVLEMCARANQIASSQSMLSMIDRQRELAGRILSPEALERLKHATQRTKDGDLHKTTLFFRAQLLELTRWALLFCDQETPPLEGEWTQTEKDLFVQAALICSWLSEVKVRAVLQDNEDVDALKDSPLVVFRQALDAGLAGVDPWRVVGRGKRLFLEYLPKHYPDLDSDFREATGVSPLEYMTAAGALVSMHLQLENTMVLSDAVTLGHATDYAAVYSTYQAHQIWNIDDLRERLWPGGRAPNSFDDASGFSLKPLRERPIIALDDGRGIIPDPLLLADSYMVGPLFQLLNQRDSNEVFGHFGDAFEEYAGDILADVFPSGFGLHKFLHRDVVLPDADGREFQIDACLDYVDQLVLLEAKAVFISDKIVVECNETDFRAELREKYLYGERPVGIGQLARAIRSLAAGAWQGIDQNSRPQLVYPVLLVYDRLLQEPLVTSFFADLLVEELDASQVQSSWQWETDGFRFAPLTILTIDDLENLESSPGIDILDLLSHMIRMLPSKRTLNRIPESSR